MNKLKGIVHGITSDAYISVIEIDAEGRKLAAISTGKQEADDLQIGDEVMVGFKETAMSIAKQLMGVLSIQNRFDLVIKSMDMDKVLTKIRLFDGTHHFISVITTASALRMQLTEGDKVVGLVKTTDLIFKKIKT